MLRRRAGDLFVASCFAIEVMFGVVKNAYRRQLGDRVLICEVEAFVKGIA